MQNSTTTLPTNHQTNDKSTPKPIDMEITLGYDEMLFSHTDKKGSILFGNEVFVRLSEFELPELIGKPHNIIRHPDMPRVIFRLFWQELLAGNSIIAYVKNRSKSGRHYWVLAMGLPCQGFLSIRIRPGSDLFKKIQMVYKQLLSIEKSGGMDAAAQFLTTELAGLGYTTYTDFMTDALISEIFNRESKYSGNPQATEQISQIETIWKLSQTLSARTQHINDMFSRIHFYCLNLTIKSTKYGKDGDGISVISTVFQQRGDEIIAIFKTFAADHAQFNTLLNSIRLALGCNILQCQMTEYFNKEASNSEEYKKILTEISTSGPAIERARTELGQLNRIFTQFKTNSIKLKQGFLALKIIRLNSRVETAALPDGGAQVQSIVDEISKFLLDASAEIDAIEADIQQLNLLITTLAKF